jgi:WD40 repeat protein
MNALAPMRFVTGGCDNKVKIWEISDDEPDNLQLSIKSFKNTKVLSDHKDWVRDVAWLNYVGYAYDTIASCSEVIYWFNALGRTRIYL